MKSRKTRTLVALGGVVISGFLLMATSFAEDKKEIKLDFENAIQTIPEIIFKPSLRDTNHVELKNEIGTKLIRIITNGNSFLLKKHGEGSSVEGSGSTVLGGVSNNVDNSHYSTIVAGSNNQISNSTHATIGGGSGNRVSGDYGTVAGGENNVAQKYSAVVGGKDNVAGGDYSVVLGNSNETHGSYSVAMGSDAIVNGDRSFLWNDGSAEKTLVGNDMFAVNGASGMVVNATKAHRFAQLTIGGSLSINDSNAAVECKPGVLKVVNRTDVANQVCFCSCDGTKWNSLFGGGKCNKICDSTYPDVSCDNNSATKICEGSNISYSGGCLVGEVVQGTGAFLVDNKGELHWTCQTRDGSQEQCHGKIKTKGTCNDPKGTFVCTGKPNHAEFLPGTDSGLTDNTGPTLYNTRAEAQADTTKKCIWYCEDGYYLEGDYCLKKKPCNGCPSGEVESGLTCESYSKGSVTSPENCPEKVISTCDNGTWDVAPGNYLSCTKYYRSCTSSACGTKSDGASCTTYDRCSSTPITSVCNDGTWSRTPGAYSSPNQGCNGCSSSACGSRTNGQSCTTYDRCSSTAITSVCNDGTWSRTPGAYSSPNQGCNGCPASGGCPATSNGQSCTSYAKCSTTSKTSTCIDGSWSSTPYGYSSPNQGCSGCDGCPTGAVSNGGKCESYKVCSSTKITSTCNNGNWNEQPGEYSLPNQGQCVQERKCGSTNKPSGSGIEWGKDDGSSASWTYTDATTPGSCEWTCQGGYHVNDNETGCDEDPVELCVGPCGSANGDLGSLTCYKPVQCTSTSTTSPSETRQCLNGDWLDSDLNKSNFPSTYTKSSPTLTSKTCSSTSYPLTTQPDATNGTRTSCTEYSQDGTKNACKAGITRYKLTCNNGYHLSSDGTKCEPDATQCTYNGTKYDVGDTVQVYASTSPTCPTECSKVTATCQSNGGWNKTMYSSCTPQGTSCSATDYPLTSKNVSNAKSYNTCTYYTVSSNTCSSAKYRYSVVCNDGFYLSSDGKSCVRKCEYNGTKYDVGDTVQVYASTSPTCPTECSKVTATCQSNGGWNKTMYSSCTPQGTSCSATDYPLTSKNVSNAKSYNTCTYYTVSSNTCSSAKYRYSVVCNDGYYLSSDGKSCLPLCNSSTNPGSCNGGFSPVFGGVATYLSSYSYTCNGYSCSANCPSGNYWLGYNCNEGNSLCGSTHDICVSSSSLVSGSSSSKTSGTTTTYGWSCKRGDKTQKCTQTVTTCDNSPAQDCEIGEQGYSADGSWDEQNCSCICPQGTSFNGGHGCECPSGQSWNGSKCVSACAGYENQIYGCTHTNGQNTVEGTWNYTTCSCNCPSGATFDGINCRDESGGGNDSYCDCSSCGEGWIPGVCTNGTFNGGCGQSDTGQCDCRPADC